MDRTPVEQAQRTQFSVIGVHRYLPSQEELEETFRWLYMDNLSAEQAVEAREQVQAQYNSLYVIEVEGEALAGHFAWGEITQADSSIDRSDWQVPYDERPIDESKTRWAFFFHFLDVNEPLLTPFGPVALPAPTPMPDYLSDMVYDAP